MLVVFGWDSLPRGKAASGNTVSNTQAHYTRKPKGKRILVSGLCTWGDLVGVVRR